MSTLTPPRHRSRERTAVVSVDRARQVYREPERPAVKPRSAGHSLAVNFSLAMLLSLAIWGGVYALQSNTFRVRQVTIIGATADLDTQLGDLIAPGCAQSAPGHVECSDATLGPNILPLNSAELVKELTTAPAVKSATVTAQLPFSLSVVIVQRQPEAAWVVGSDILRVAGDGVVVDHGSPDGMKVVIGQVAGTPVKPGDTIDPAVIQGAELLQRALASQLGMAGARIQYSPTDGLAVVGAGGLIAMFGPPADLNLKIAELQRILQVLGDKKATLAFVDLRYKTPYYRTR